jgi:hypothetical protein
MGKDEEEQSSRGFKVEDRRRFIDDAEPEREPEPAPAAAAAAPSPGPKVPPTEHGPQHQEINFTTFVMGLSTQALMHLGEIGESGAPPTPDLPAAKQMIDLLGVLREKTTGNLDAAEEQLLASMLYDLRMRYVEVSRHR